MGSLQAYIHADGDCEEQGYALFPASEVRPRLRFPQLVSVPAAWHASCPTTKLLFGAFFDVYHFPFPLVTPPPAFPIVSLLNASFHATLRRSKSATSIALLLDNFRRPPCFFHPQGFLHFIRRAIDVLIVFVGGHHCPTPKYGARGIYYLWILAFTVRSCSCRYSCVMLLPAFLRASPSCGRLAHALTSFLVLREKSFLPPTP